MTELSNLEARALSTITPEQAEALRKFLVKLPAPKQIDDSLSWDQSHRLDVTLDSIRAFLGFRGDAERPTD